jgi:hypothetical protein
MEKDSKKQINPNPLSYLFISWLNPLIQLGNSKPLEEGDLYTLADKDKAESIANLFGPFSDSLRKGNDPNIVMECFRNAFWPL